MHFLHGLLTFIFHLGYFGPFVMGVLDSSFLVLPFGNDFVVVGLVAQHHQHGVWLYVLSAATGSTVGALLLAFVARTIGEERIRRVTGERQFNKLCGWISSHAALSIVAGGLAPPPFPYTVIIAAAGALDYPIPRIGIANVLARALRFSLLAWLALHFGKQVLAVANSAVFRGCMIGFVILCLIATGFSLWKWFHQGGDGKRKPGEQAA